MRAGREIRCWRNMRSFYRLNLSPNERDAAPPARFGQESALQFPLGHLLALLARFREADRNRLLAALDLAAAATAAALEGAALALAHGTFDILRRPAGIFSSHAD